MERGDRGGKGVSRRYTGAGSQRGRGGGATTRKRVRAGMFGDRTHSAVLPLAPSPTSRREAAFAGSHALAAARESSIIALSLVSIEPACAAGEVISFARREAKLPSRWSSFTQPTIGRKMRSACEGREGGG